MESQANRKADATNQDDGSEQSEELRLRLEAQRFMDERMKDKIPATKKTTKEATIPEGQSDILETMSIISLYQRLLYNSHHCHGNFVMTLLGVA